MTILLSLLTDLLNFSNKSSCLQFQRKFEAWLDKISSELAMKIDVQMSFKSWAFFDFLCWKRLCNQISNHFYVLKLYDLKKEMKLPGSSPYLTTALSALSLISRLNDFFRYTKKNAQAQRAEDKFTNLSKMFTKRLRQWWLDSFPYSCTSLNLVLVLACAFIEYTPHGSASNFVCFVYRNFPTNDSVFHSYLRSFHLASGRRFLYN